MPDEIALALSERDQRIRDLEHSIQSFRTELQGVVISRDSHAGHVHHLEKRQKELLDERVLLLNKVTGLIAGLRHLYQHLTAPALNMNYDYYEQPCEKVHDRIREFLQGLPDT